MISDCLVKEQQALSNAYNLICFDDEGNISTVPKSHCIDYFTGYGKLTREEFEKYCEINYITIRCNLR